MAFNENLKVITEDAGGKLIEVEPAPFRAFMWFEEFRLTFSMSKGVNINKVFIFVGSEIIFIFKDSDVGESETGFFSDFATSSNFGGFAILEITASSAPSVIAVIRIKTLAEEELVVGIEDENADAGLRAEGGVGFHEDWLLFEVGEVVHRLSNE